MYNKFEQISYTNGPSRPANHRRLLPNTSHQTQRFPNINMQQVNTITFSYRDLALAYHPALQHQNPNRAYQKFAEIAEAFDVLYDCTDGLNQLKRRRYMTSSDNKN